MRATFATEPGTPGRACEDWVLVSCDLAVVLDGATARTDTGCQHGVAWFAHQLGAAIVANAAIRASDLADGVAMAVEQVAALHPQCDLTHPGTPSAAVGVVRTVGPLLDYLVLGDVSVVLRTDTGVTAITDDRVSRTAQPDRSQAERLPIGSPQKAAALLRMKHGELAARNRDGGYWVAANDPDAVKHAFTGRVPLRTLHDLAVLTDGAARAVVPFGQYEWAGLLDVLRTAGPGEVIRSVRAAETQDPDGSRWPRNKRSDDATALYISGFAESGDE